jgi:DNA-binding NtrC family response regulator
VSNLIVFVFESRSYWTPELQRQFQNEEIRVRACSNIGDVRRHADSHTSQYPKACQLVVLSLDAGPAECLQFLGRSKQLGSFAVIVVGSPTTMELEWSIRELGAFEFVPHDIAGDDLARLCQRQLTAAFAEFN